MADQKISELTNITGANLADGDELVVVDTSASETKAITFGEFKNALDTSTGFVRITGDTMTGDLTVPNVVVSGNVDGRDVSADGSKLDGIEASADVTDTANVTAAGALMDSELTDIAAVKALNQGVATTDDPTFTNTQLAALAATISDTAVDIFVYDTRKDSDGGAWRKRTQHTSWYNETLNTATRGSRKEFPSVAVIVAESNKVTIYDGDDPDLPMWMVFSPAGLNIVNTSAASLSISALNGRMIIGDPLFDLKGVDFIADRAARVGTTTIRGMFLGDISQRNDGKGWASNQDTFLAAGPIVNRNVNDVAMTVLPNAPIDAATGLPVPTIACLVAETKVQMADGSTKRLDQVEVGDVVKTLEGHHSVLNWWDQGVKDVVELTFDGGQQITCTSDHKIRTTDGWVEAGDLTDAHEVVGL